MSGLAPELRVVASGMIRGAMGLVGTMTESRDTAIALRYELDRQHGMAGDDDAGHHFAKAYQQAAATTLDQLGFSAYVLGATGRGLLRNAREFMSTDHAVAALLGAQADLTDGFGDPGADCTENFLDLGQHLPDVIGKTAWHDQYAPGGRSDRYRGSPDKIREVATSWRHAGRLVLRFLEDAQAYASTASNAHTGLAAESFHTYFKNSVGLTCPPERAQENEPLITNLVAACNQLAKACDRYADHVEQAQRKIQQHHSDPFTLDMPWEQPMFGGNGFDGGLKDAVLEDTYIHQLGDVAHALDSAKARIRLPQGSGGPPPPWQPFPPLVPGPVPAPLTLASYSGRLPALLPRGNDIDPTVPWADPIPPAPGTTRLLSPAEQQSFRTWMNALTPGGFAGGGGPNNPDNAYQLRIAGYPEREVPLAGRKVGLMVDGIRPTDGYLVEAKHVRDPDCKKKSFRSLDRVDETLTKPVKATVVDGKEKIQWDPVVDSMYAGDEAELTRYKQAMANPANSEIRGLEVVTNGKDNAAYWQSMMAMTGTPGSTRYVP